MFKLLVSNMRRDHFTSKHLQRNTSSNEATAKIEIHQSSIHCCTKTEAIFIKEKPHACIKHLVILQSMRKHFSRSGGSFTEISRLYAGSSLASRSFNNKMRKIAEQQKNEEGVTILGRIFTQLYNCGTRWISSDFCRRASDRF